MDATDEASVRRALDAFRNDTKNHIDVLVYNCGARRLRPYGVEETWAETFKRFWEINCFGAFLCARNVFADMKKNGGGCIILEPLRVCEAVPGAQTFRPASLDCAACRKRSMRKELHTT